MKILFSRHAKRRAKLYSIPEEKISAILAASPLRKGEQMLIRTIPGLKYPLKIVVSVQDDVITVITNYPLKKGRKK